MPFFLKRLFGVLVLVAFGVSATNPCLYIGVSTLMFKSLFGLRYSVSKNWIWCQYAYVEGLVRVAVGNLDAVRGCQYAYV